MDIGRRIYDGEISKYDAAEQYDIRWQTARDYMRMYRNENHLQPKRGCRMKIPRYFPFSPRLHHPKMMCGSGREMADAGGRNGTHNP